jgi:hypothetical protein
MLAWVYDASLLCQSLNSDNFYSFGQLKVVQKLSTNICD